MLTYHKRHPQEMGVDEIRTYLSHLATEKKVAASTQNIALSALMFLYRQVMQVDLPNIDDVVRARQNRRLPVVLTRDKVKKLLANMEGVECLVASLLYGTGMRLLEGLRLRVKDIDFGRNAIIIRDGKGAEDRIVMLPDRSLAPLRNQLEYARTLHLIGRSDSKSYEKGAETRRN
jgi:site-specific recombinase XerD